MNTAPHIQRQWTIWHALGAVLLVGASIAVAYDAWATLFHIAAKDTESSHIFLVAVAAPWIVLVRKHQLAKCRPVMTWLGPLIVAVGWGCLIYGWDIHDKEFWFFGAIVMAIGCVVSFVGGQVLWKALPAFLVLGFLIPVPGLIRMSISIPLQTIMAGLTQHVGEFMGIIINRAGNVLVVNGQPIEVAEACNGMRMVFGLFLVAYTFAFVTPLRWWARGLVLLSAPLLALLCNLIRIVPTVWLYGYAETETADTFHEIAGWMVIPLGFFVLTGTVSVLEWLGVPVIVPATRRRPAAEPAAPDRPIMEQPA